MKISGLCFLAVFLFLSSGCQKTPMQKLQSDTVHAELTPGYWAKVHTENKPLWQEATAYCQKHYEKLNCGNLMTVFIISNGDTTGPINKHPINIQSITKAFGENRG